MNDQFVCVNCHRYVRDLYHWYSPTNIKLHVCQQCGKIADKYVEYDQVIVFIELVIFNRNAYRHVLFNSAFKNHWKLAIIILLLKTYCQWMNISTELFGTHVHMASEHSFYLSAITAAIGAVTYVTFLLFNISLFEYYKSKRMPNWELLLIQWKAIVLSNMSWFLILPSLIWKDQIISINFLFFATYLILSQRQALSVTCSTPRTLLLAILSVSLALESLTVYKIEGWINNSLYNT